MEKSRDVGMGKGRINEDTKVVQTRGLAGQHECMTSFCV